MDHLRGAALGVLSGLISDPDDRRAESSTAPRARSAATAGDASFPPGDVDRFARLVMGADMARVEAFLDQLRERGLAPEALYQGLVLVARRLGEWWLDDSCSFSDVTLGTIRLQQVLRALGPWFRGTIECPRPGHRILLVPSPGEQHTFGLFIVADFLAREGWDVWGETSAGDGMLRIVGDEWFDLIGISVGCVSRLDAVAAQIQRLRSASCNRTVGIMVGGPIFVEHPEYAASVGADATAAEGSGAARAAESLLTSIKRKG